MPPSPRPHARTPRGSSHRTLQLALLALSFLASRAAFAQATYGTMSNFDVFNDTGQECHGFEIELDGLSSKDVTFTFGSPYQRYGNPTVADLPGGGGVSIRYESPYVNNAFTQATPTAPAVITPTDGHACWTGGSANYLTSGCEHFGVGVTGNPTNTAYRWLIADPNSPGRLIASPTKVSIPAPTWNVAPPPQGWRESGRASRDPRRTAGGAAAIWRRHVGQGFRHRVGG